MLLILNNDADGVTDFVATTQYRCQIGLEDANNVCNEDLPRRPLVATVAGSGDVTLDPVVAAVSTPRTFTVEYTALTDLTDTILQITPDGVVIMNDTATTTIR